MRAIRWVGGVLREVVRTLVGLAGNPEAWVAVAIAGVLLSACGIFDRTTMWDNYQQITSPEMLARIREAQEFDWARRAKP